MTKLEQEINKALMENRPGKGGVTTSSLIAKYAAEVAIKYIEKAFMDGYYAMAGLPLTEEEMADGSSPAQICWNRWLKENGVLPADDWGTRVKSPWFPSHGTIDRPRKK